MKKCNTCLVEKDTCEYYKDNRSKDKFQENDKIIYVESMKFILI